MKKNLKDKNLKNKITDGLEKSGSFFKGMKDKAVSLTSSDKKAKVMKKAKKAGAKVDEHAQNIQNEVTELTDNIKGGKKLRKSGINSIKFKLIGGFLVPVVLIIVLGVISYKTASNAIIDSYINSTASTIIKTADYYNLMFNNIESASKEMISNVDAKNYYSKLHKSDISEESKVYNSINQYYQAITISNSMVNNIYVLCNYGKQITTTSVTNNNLYEAFAASEEAANIDANKLVWATKRSYLDTIVSPRYGVTLERQFYSNSTKAIGYLILDINYDMVTTPLTDLDLGEGSVVAFVAPDGGEVNNVDDTDYFAGQDFMNAVISNPEAENGYEYVADGEQLFLYSKTDAGFVVCALVPKDIITTQASTILITTIIVVIIAFVIAMAIGGVLSLGISTSIHVIMKKLGAVAEGDLTTSVNMRRRDEFGVLGDSINNMIGRTKNMVEDTVGISGELGDSINTVKDNTDVLLNATKSITDAITGIEDGIIQQASDAEGCMKQMDVLAEKITNVANNTELIASVASDAIVTVKDGLVSIDELSEKAKDTVKVSTEIIEGIQSMEAASKKIGAIITAINEIADQTSLLSLNASIEAARAGDSGRGFAVVAEEIRKLADQSVDSANQIKLIVDDINVKTKDTVGVARKAENIIASQEDSLNKTVSVFNLIETQVGGLASNIEIIKSSVEDITGAKNETLMSIQNISAVSEETAASIEEVASTAEKQLQAVSDLNEEARELADNSDKLIETVSVFKVN